MIRYSCPSKEKQYPDDKSFFPRLVSTSPLTRTSPSLMTNLASAPLLTASANLSNCPK